MFSHITVQISVRAAIIRRLDHGYRIHFQDASLSYWQEACHRGAWLFSWQASPRACDPRESKTKLKYLLGPSLQSQKPSFPISYWWHRSAQFSMGGGHTWAWILEGKALQGHCRGWLPQTLTRAKVLCRAQLGMGKKVPFLKEVYSNLGD